MYKKLFACFGILLLLASTLLVSSVDVQAKETVSMTTIAAGDVTSKFDFATGRTIYTLTNLRPNYLMPSNCNPITWWWETSGPAYEHPGSNYTYVVDVHVACTNHENFMFAWNGGPKTWLTEVAMVEDSSNDEYGCSSPGINASPNNNLAQCAQYAGWQNGEAYTFWMYTTPQAQTGCPGYVAQAWRLKYNYGTMASPLWQEIIYQQRNSTVYRYCT